MIAVDATPLALETPGGVRRALAELVAGWARISRPRPVVLFAPKRLPDDTPALDGVVVPSRAARSGRAFRRMLPALLAAEGAETLWSPWSAFPRVPLPVVAVVHELPFVRLGTIEGRLRTWRHRHWLARNTAECAAIVVPSFAVRDDLLSLGACSAGKVHVVPNAFDPQPWAEAARPPASPRRVVVVGTGHGAAGARKKGIDTLLEAFAALPADPTLELHVVGRLSSPPPGAHVVHGPTDEELRTLVASAWLLVHPARSEGFGYPPLEAMAAGVPVVTTDGGALPEVTGDAALHVPAGDADALALAIGEVATDEGLRTRLIAAGHERALAFPPDTTARMAQDLLIAVA